MKLVKRILKWTGLVMVGAVLVSALYLSVAYWTSTNDCDSKTGVSANPMKAIVYCEYGGPEVLTLADIEKPTPSDSQILIRVHAASLNPLDLGYHGFWLLRPVTGMRKPKNTRLGVDYAGIVEAVGKNVAQFKPGDEVFGATKGALAEYVCVLPDRAVTLKPANITFEQAACVSVAAITALQGLRDKGKIKPGQKVLVNGASGGVGTFAVQIAKSYGAEVTAVCSTRNVEMVRSIGADRVIDYTKEDFTKTEQRYDLIFDIVGNHTFSERRRILKPDGICVMAGLGGSGWHDETAGRLLGQLNAYLRSRFVNEKFMTYLAHLNEPDLAILASLIKEGKIVPVIDKTYRFNDVPAAVAHLETGHASGKIVVMID